MRAGRRKKRGRKKAEGFTGLQGIEFDLDAIRDIKKRKRRLCKRGSSGKS